MADFYSHIFQVVDRLLLWLMIPSLAFPLFLTMFLILSFMSISPDLNNAWIKTTCNAEARASMKSCKTPALTNIPPF